MKMKRDEITRHKRPKFCERKKALISIDRSMGLTFNAKLPRQRQQQQPQPQPQPRPRPQRRMGTEGPPVWTHVGTRNVDGPNGEVLEEVNECKFYEKDVVITTTRKRDGVMIFQEKETVDKYEFGGVEGPLLSEGAKGLANPRGKISDHWTGTQLSDAYLHNPSPAGSSATGVYGPPHKPATGSMGRKTGGW